MATLCNNALVSGLSGSIGNLMFRQYGGRTILSAKGSGPRRQSEWQRANRNRFKEASAYAKLIMMDADKKAYYWRKAKKLKLPNAYTAALSDYMRKGEIKEIDTKQYKGKAGNVFRILAYKKDFAVNTVKLTLSSADGRVIESDYAMKKDQGVFFYKATQNIDRQCLHMKVELCDFRNDTVLEERVLTW